MSQLVGVQLASLVAVRVLLGQLKLGLPQLADQILQSGDVRLVILVQLAFLLLEASDFSLHTRGQLVCQSLHSPFGRRLDVHDCNLELADLARQISYQAAYLAVLQRL